MLSTRLVPAPAEAGLEQFVEFVDYPQRLGAGVHRALHVGEHLALQRQRDAHAPAQHQPGDVLGAIGDFVLYTEQLQQIGARHRKEQALGQVHPDVLLQPIGFLLQSHHVLLNLFDLRPVLGDHRAEERQQAGRAFVGLGDVLLHRPDRRTAEQADERIGRHGTPP